MTLILRIKGISKTYIAADCQVNTNWHYPIPDKETGKPICNTKLLQNSFGMSVGISGFLSFNNFSILDCINDLLQSHPDATGKEFIIELRTRLSSLAGTVTLPDKTILSISCPSSGDVDYIIQKATVKQLDISTDKDVYHDGILKRFCKKYNLDYDSLTNYVKSEKFRSDVDINFDHSNMDDRNPNHPSTIYGLIAGVFLKHQQENEDIDNIEESKITEIINEIYTIIQECKTCRDIVTKELDIIRTIGPLDKIYSIDKNLDGADSEENNKTE